ncbi:hypothetical protein [Phytohalomonas tamaricis]|uniref:hypothetical protein n=1 Tax=Phytohalomonas tamaricis TaxID=2081032 RepID=UPI000D0BDE1B|nr:hypothetical protein [Phytohalomonas tamaricis]
MKRFFLLLLAALGGAAILSALASSAPFEQRLIRVEAAHALPALADELASESDALNALFLAYADDEALWLAARLALVRYGDTARTVLSEYEFDPAFQRVLARFGADVVLPIAYFHRHEIDALSARHWASRQYERASDSLAQWWRTDDASPANDELNDEMAPANTSLTPHQRGDYAIAYLDAEGHDFLGQFVVDRQGDVRWLQSERVVSSLSNFFTRGIRDLESKWRQNDDIGVADAAWAGMDLLVMASAVKLLRAGRTLRAGSIEAQSVRTGTQTVAGGEISAGVRFSELSRGARLAAVGATTYVIVRHPGLISALGANVAQWAGLPVKLMQFALWAMILMPLLAVACWLYRLFLVPVLWLLYRILRLSSRASH